MTIQQLQYVLEIAKTGSVSKAAKNLFLSQPNLSNAIKNLEHELGMVIFERNPMGMHLTAKGQKLVSKAASIMADIRAITSEEEEKDCLFRLVYPRYIPAFQAFEELCRRYEDREPFHFSCYIGDGERQVEALYKNLCDMVVYIHEGGGKLERLCSDLHITFHVLKEVNFCVQLSVDHPLLKEETFDLTKLGSYPYVAFADLQDREADWMPWGHIVNPNRLIRVQSTSSRVSLVSHTHAFSMVLPHSEAYNQAHHVVQIPFPNQILKLGCLYSTDRGMGEFGQAYIELFKKILEPL